MTSSDDQTATSDRYSGFQGFSLFYSTPSLRKYVSNLEFRMQEKTAMQKKLENKDRSTFYAVSAMTLRNAKFSVWCEIQFISIFPFHKESGQNLCKLSTMKIENW